MIRKIQTAFLMALLIGFIFYLGRIIVFLINIRNDLISQWNTGQLKKLALEESNLEGLLLGNFILLVFFSLDLINNIVRSIQIRYKRHKFEGHNVHDPFPLKSTIVLIFLMTVQTVVFLDLLAILDQYNINVFGFNIHTGTTIETLLPILEPLQLQQIIIINLLFTFITIFIIYNKSALKTYINDKSVFSVDYDFITTPYLASIISQTDPVLKNLKITQGYRDLSIAISQLLGRDNANWATYASWA